jgi:serine/threonine protein phosphatase PrpC
MIAVVCDGVGSLGRSDEAAALVSRRLACLGAAGLPWPQAFFRANEALREFVAESADEEGTDSAANSMATTAVALAVHREVRDWVGTQVTRTRETTLVITRLLGSVGSRGISV